MDEATRREILDVVAAEFGLTTKAAQKAANELAQDQFAEDVLSRDHTQEELDEWEKAGVFSRNDRPHLILNAIMRKQHEIDENARHTAALKELGSNVSVEEYRRIVEQYHDIPF